MQVLKIMYEAGGSSVVNTNQQSEQWLLISVELTISETVSTQQRLTPYRQKAPKEVTFCQSTENHQEKTLRDTWASWTLNEDLQTLSGTDELLIGRRETCGTYTSPNLLEYCVDFRERIDNCKCFNQ